MVSTGTAIDAVTTAAVINAARALMISSLNLSFWAISSLQFGCVVTVFVTLGFVSLANGAYSNTNARKGNTYK